MVGSEVVGDTDGDAVGSEVVGDNDGDMVGSEVVGAIEGDTVGSEVVGEAVGDADGRWVHPAQVTGHFKRHVSSDGSLQSVLSPETATSSAQYSSVSWSS
jgi:hypothetical protein